MAVAIVPRPELLPYERLQIERKERADHLSNLHEPAAKDIELVPDDGRAEADLCEARVPRRISRTCSCLEQSLCLGGRPLTSAGGTVPVHLRVQASRSLWPSGHRVSVRIIFRGIGSFRMPAAHARVLALPPEVDEDPTLLCGCCDAGCAPLAPAVAAPAAAGPAAVAASEPLLGIVFMLAAAAPASNSRLPCGLHVGGTKKARAGVADGAHRLGARTSQDTRTRRSAAGLRFFSQW